jgi:hypothetical protein
LARVRLVWLVPEFLVGLDSVQRWVVLACLGLDFGHVALWAFAFQAGVLLAEYVRGIVHDRVVQSGAASRESGAALRAIINAGKVWIIAYRALLQLDWASERLHSRTF